MKLLFLNFPITIFAFIIFPFILEYGFVAFYESSELYAIPFFIIKSLILCFPFLIFPKYAKKILYLIYTFVYLPLLINICHMLLFGCALSECSLFSMFETTIGESIDFLEHFYNLKLLIFIIFYLAIPILIIKKFFPKSFNISLKKNQKIVCGLLFIAGYLAFACGDGRYRYPFEKIFYSYMKYRVEVYERKKIRDDRQHFNYGNIKSVIDKNKKQTYLVVIGESVDKKHMSLYGYSRNTTPNFDKIKNELCIFKNVRSGFCQTNAVMKCILLFDQNFKKGDIISFLNEAGFKTFWFSNQHTSGRYNSTEAMVASQASEFSFINRTYFRVNKTSQYDEALLKCLNYALKDPSDKKVIFLHLFGSHSVYNKRYPKEFDLFTDPNFTPRANKVAEYDNSIAYTDYVLMQALENLKKSDGGIKIFVYLSDHGEDAYDTDESTFSHASGSSPHMFDIPLIAWFSDEFKKERKNYFESIDLSKKYKTDVMIHSLLDIFGLEHAMIKKEFSIFRNDNDEKK